jgi:4-hydroxy-tetrahydrodipicolinate synthase
VSSTRPGDQSGPLFTGIGVALVTLFGEQGELLAPQTADLAAALAGRGVSAVLVAGSTGEPWALSSAERTELCQAVRARLPAHIPVLLGTGAFSGWDETEQMTAGCAQSGADAYLIMPPPGIAADAGHFARLRDIAGDTPVWAYHVPGVSAPGVPLDTVGQLDVAAIKDSSGDADRLAAEMTRYAVGRPLYVGSPTVLTLARALGAAGAILALANTVPELCAAAFGGDLPAQAEVARLHIESLTGFPAGLKKEVSNTYGTSAVTRPRSR